MSRRAFITSENRRRQFLAEQRELQAHGMPNWFDNRPKRPTRKLSRQQRQSQTDRRIAVNESIRASARPGNSQWLILPTNNGQTVRPAPFQPGTATIPPVKEPSCSTLGTARP